MGFPQRACLTLPCTGSVRLSVGPSVRLSVLATPGVATAAYSRLTDAPTAVQSIAVGQTIHRRLASLLRSTAAVGQRGEATRRAGK